MYLFFQTFLTSSSLQFDISKVKNFFCCASFLTLFFQFFFDFW